ncbi:hypothetical protein C7413_10111 [Paraburkholderia silvatlantica]|nr:hypothetical protein [Paraburkholderia silvatlantica]PVY37396.1 hypothetical protein C7411_10111 [Paraburkholderia silvatlantica]PXW42358.1 hypothetical protein C7413_10111 [Paraburkholderia silvatlantica]
MKPKATRNRSGKRAHPSPDDSANKAVAGGESLQTAQTRHVAARPQTAKAIPVEAQSARAARHRKDHVKQEKVVRDTFTMPREDYQQLAVLKQRCLDAGLAVKKSELVRAGLLLLASEPTKRLLAAVKAVEPVKTGRPPKSK